MEPSPLFEKAILDVTLQLASPYDQDAYLKSACGGDTELRQRIEAQLRAHEKTGTTTAELPADAFFDAQTTVFFPSVTEKPSESIGRYKLLQKLGEGGYGAVYLAEQTSPVRRQVALKIIKPGMDSRQVLARFEAERQALALMDHPNIAKVLDAGTTESGRPFFAMELVRGARITDYCDQNSLSTRERLELFLQVCRAIQHAHQKGIIHRDIKPSNILVASQDGTPLPKVIDFGIAKAIEQPLTEKTLFTAFDRFIGTPTYMSPEQAGLDSQDIDTRSDIYSLGVLLYELLTGKTPFEPKDLMRAGIDEMRRILREKEPPRPSTRLSALDNAEQTTLARRRQCEPPRLLHLVRGDLDWVVMKCLEKDRRRRYETASGVASDIQRHLGYQPVEARSPSSLYRFQKMVVRNKLAVGALGAVAATLVLGLGLSTWLWLKEREARRLSVAAQQQAAAEATKSRQVAAFLKETLQGVGPSVALGRDTTLLQEILARTAKRVGTDLANQPEVEAELRNTIGDIYSELAQWDKAEAMIQRALELRRQLFGSEHLAVAESLNSLACVVWGQGQLPEAEALYREVLATENKQAGARGPEVGATLGNLAGVLREQGKLDQAEQVYRQALALLRNAPQKENANIASTLSCLATVLWNKGNLAEAETLHREALAMRRKLLGELHPDVSISLNNLAAVLYGRKKLAEAESINREALALKRKVLGEEHPDVATSLQNLAAILHEQEKFALAEPLLRECLVIREKHTPKDWRLYSTRSALGGCLLAQKQFVQAEPLLLEGYEGLVKAQQNLPVVSKPRLKEALERLVQLHEAAGHPDQAAQWKHKLQELNSESSTSAVSGN